ncbi:MAG: phage replisome organizer N-terminal domain-containing protein [Clostridia bacterium]|nr:phage replisome organizer N-terminal domain-containing protein [Clostridia bacterium]
MSKRYYWLKLKEDFFDEKYIKALRKLPDGNALVIVYLKMQLKSLKTEGLLKYEHILPSAEEELALVLDEDVNLVKLTLAAISNMGLVEKWDNDTFYMSALQPLIGSETEVAKRVRKHRELKNQEQKLLQCNINETNCNTDIEKREKRKEKETEQETDIEKKLCPPKAGDETVKTEIVEGYEVKFNEFYSAYPKKVNKQQVQKWFKKNKPNDKQFDYMMQRLQEFKKSKDWIKDKGQFIPYPSTWLNQKRWEDEGVIEKQTQQTETAEEKYKNNIFMQILEEEKNGQRNDY